MNVLDTLPKKLQAEAREWLTKIPYAATRAEAERLKRAFQAWATKTGVAAAGRRLEEDWERLVTFYAFPKEHWKHLRTTNVVESPFAAVRLRTAAAKRFSGRPERNNRAEALGRGLLESALETHGPAQESILRERHTDHIVLGGDGAKIFLTDKQTTSEFNLGISLTLADTAMGWKESRR